MKKLFTALILLLCISIPAFSQGNVLVPDKEQPGTALIFSLYGLNTLGAGNFDEFAGRLDSLSAGFGIKHFINPKLALRAGLGFTSQSSSQDVGTINTKISGFTFLVLPGLEYHLLRTEKVSAYLGGQLVFGILSAKLEVSGSPVVNSTEEMSATIFGLGPFLGVEWFAFRNVSLGAEYQLNFLTASGTEKTTQGGTTTETDVGPTTEFLLQSNGRLNFNIAFYF